MARLNEPLMSTDSLEILRKKMLRQNRDLAKSNNVRALRIRELENECACMLSENLELRGRILELEAQVEDNEARRIADHAMAIKDRLEAQLTEWGTLIAGLGLEPPMKRHSPRIRKTIKQRMSFNPNRPSPSRRRLREVAREIEELGHISEVKVSPRRTMNPEEIMALRSEALEPIESPELGPPPTSRFLDEDPVKIDSPTRPQPEQSYQLSPVIIKNLPEILSSPKANKKPEEPASPTKKMEPAPRGLDSQPTSTAMTDQTPNASIKAGSKRKFAVRDDDVEVFLPRHLTNENEQPRMFADKQSIREKAGGKTLKELTSIRKEAREKQTSLTSNRKPLSAKSINNDISSPKKKHSKPVVMDDVAAAKSDLVKAKASQERARPRTKNPPPVKIESISPPIISPPTTVMVTSELGVPVADGALFSPTSPDPTPFGNVHRGDTPPPADISSMGETSRPSRRNRTSVSYAEPNLRDKMRRPGKELYDAVTGEGKYSRRSSQCEPLPLDTARVKRESDVGDSARQTLSGQKRRHESEPDAMPGSPLAGKGLSLDGFANSGVTERRRRPSSVASRSILEASQEKNREGDSEAGKMGDSDIYDFESSSLKLDDEGSEEVRRPSRRQSASTRRTSSSVDSEGSVSQREQAASRRRSMMV